MPQKIRDLEAELARAGFVCTQGKGSHRKWWHPTAGRIVVAGRFGHDAKPEKVKDVLAALRRAAHAPDAA